MLIAVSTAPLETTIHRSLLKLGQLCLLPKLVAVQHCTPSLSGTVTAPPQLIRDVGNSLTTKVCPFHMVVHPLRMFASYTSEVILPGWLSCPVTMTLWLLLYLFQLRPVNPLTQRYQVAPVD